MLIIFIRKCSVKQRSIFIATIPAPAEKAAAISLRKYSKWPVKTYPHEKIKLRGISFEALDGY